MRRTWIRSLTLRALLLLVLVLLCGLPAQAHVGSKDVFEELNAGPYKLFVTVRMPVVIPGVATLEVRSSGAPVDTIEITPVPMVGESSKHPPTADPMKRSADDPNFYTGSLWIMASGSWKVQFTVHGPQGSTTAAVPVPAMPLSVLTMQRPMGVALGGLGLILAIGMAGIVAAAVRESRVAPGATPGGDRRRRSAIAGLVTLLFVALAIYAGDKWWNVEAADYAGDLYHPLTLTPELQGDTLSLLISRGPSPSSGTGHPDGGRKGRSNADLVPDHGELMHLYAIREPEMDAVFHLHPSLVAPGEMELQLPALPPGEYKLYGDIVHASGFPETLTAELAVPVGLQSAPLATDDASAAPPPLSQGELGVSYKLPDGYSMVWDKPATLKANEAYGFRFRLLDPAGKPATGMQPYLGMAGHAAFVKTDGTVFAHTHPDGSAAMPAMELANGGMVAGMGMQGVSGMAGGGNPAGAANTTNAIAPEVEFPYGFPTVGRYRIFIQMKHGGVVETGVFDADVQ